MSLATLKTALETLDTKIATAASASGPTINLDGKSVDRVGWLNSLLEQRAKLQAQIILLEPAEGVVVGWSG